MNAIKKYLQAIGKRGGQETAKRGKEYYSAIGKKGGWPKGKARKKKGDK
jgi:general stress protein YciG